MKIKEGPGSYAIEQKRVTTKEASPERRQQRTLENRPKPIEQPKPYTNTQGQTTGKYVNTTA